jgi:hypothetical protein
MYYYLAWLAHTYLILMLLSGEVYIHNWTKEYKTLFVTWGVVLGLSALFVKRMVKWFENTIKKI